MRVLAKCAIFILSATVPVIGMAAQQPSKLRQEFPSLPFDQSQPCTVATIRLVLTHLQRSVDPPRNGTGYAPKAKDVQAAVCESDPGKPRETLVALMYTDQDAMGLYERDEHKYYRSSQNVSPVELAIVDEQTGQIRASGSARLSSWSPNPELDALSLKLDSADYQLAPGVHAFAVQVASGYNPSCAEGHSGPHRSLYVRDGRHIRPVLRGVRLSHTWTMQESQKNMCVSQPGPENVVEHAKTIITVAATTTQGWRDLSVRRVFWINDEPPAAHCEVTLRYDGEQYSTKPLWMADTCSHVEDRLVRATAKRFHLKRWLHVGKP